MSEKFRVPVIFTRQQVLDFGELTGDNGPIHSVKGVVQGGFILSMLPCWIKIVGAQHPLSLIGKNIAVSMALDAKFRRMLYCDTPVFVEFEFVKDGSKVNKMNWSVCDDAGVYCSGTWILHNVGKVDTNSDS